MTRTHNYLGFILQLHSNWYSDYITYNGKVIYRRLFGVLVTRKPSHVFAFQFINSEIQDIANQYFDGKL